MSNDQLIQQARDTTAISVSVAVELTTRVFQKITGSVVSDRINDASLNKQAIAGLIGAKINSELVTKVEKVQ